MRALESARARRQDGVKGDYTAAWMSFVTELASLYERVGWTGERSKRAEERFICHPSPFVYLIWTIVY